MDTLVDLTYSQNREEHSHVEQTPLTFIIILLRKKMAKTTCFTLCRSTHNFACHVLCIFPKSIHALNHNVKNSSHI